MLTTEELAQEAGRQLVICNACRYCEGYCPVFPAIELRREFNSADVFYLSNLCHDCRACYHACMYAPPHEFAINLPKILAESRIDSYRAMTWPQLLGRAFSDWKVGALIPTSAAGLVIAAAMPSLLLGKFTIAHHGPGAFYRFIPFETMLFLFGGLGFFASCAFLRAAAKFWGSSGHNRPLAKSAWQSVGDIFGLRWLAGGGPGCYYPTARPSSARRVFHALTFFGFLAAGISTVLAAYYQHFLQRLPPYPVESAPVLFGIIGGIGMVVGTAGLLVMKAYSDAEPTDDKSKEMDYVFLALLNLAALSGILTLALRGTRGLGFMLLIHVAIITGFFCSLPYGKFVHSIYRSLAIVKYRLEHNK